MNTLSTTETNTELKEAIQQKLIDKLSLQESSDDPIIQQLQEEAAVAVDALAKALSWHGGGGGTGTLVVQLLDLQKKLVTSEVQDSEAKRAGLLNEVETLHNTIAFALQDTRTAIRKVRDLRVLPPQD